MSSKLTPRAFGLVLPLTLALVLGACQKSDDSAAQAPAPGGEAASESAAPATEAAPARADVPADAQFASEDTSLADVQSMKEIATCSLESALDLASGAQNPGSAPNSADVPNIKCPLMIQSAETDERINASWPEFEKALKAARVKYERHLYPGTQHGFNNDTTPRYDAASAKQAWERTIAFFNQNLRPAAKGK